MKTGSTDSGISEYLREPQCCGSRRYTMKNRTIDSYFTVIPAGIEYISGRSSQKKELSWL